MFCRWRMCQIVCEPQWLFPLTSFCVLRLCYGVWCWVGMWAAIIVDIGLWMMYSLSMNAPQCCCPSTSHFSACFGTCLGTCPSAFLCPCCMHVYLSVCHGVCPDWASAHGRQTHASMLVTKLQVFIQKVNEELEQTSAQVVNDLPG